jgi:DNA transposition AAA+ family ATPase
MVRQLPDAICDDLRADIRHFLASRPDVGMVDLTQHTVLADSTGKNFLSGIIPGGHEVVSEFRRVLGLAQAGDILRPGRDGAVVLVEDHTEPVRRVAKSRAFYSTQTVKRVAELLDFCSENCAIGIITADFGAGKTAAVSAWRRAQTRKVESVIFEFDEFSSSNKVDFIHCLARLLGVEITIGSAAGGKVFRDVCARLRETPTLLIFDQCEVVRTRIFQVIRQIWDRTSDAGVGVVLLSAPILLARMNKSRMADMGALTSRVGVWAPLAGLGKSEMVAIVKQEGFTDIDENAFDLWHRATGGSMRRLMRAIDLLKSKHQGKRVTEKTITGIAGYLWGVTLQGASEG